MPSKHWMLSIAKLSSGQERYYLDGAGERVDVADALGDGSEDYYVDPAEARGRWAGSAAERLGLTADVDATQLRRLLGGLHPRAGSPLAEGAPRRVAAFDLTFSAPKSVSVLFGVATPAVREALRAAHDEAARQALAYLERHAAAVRRGHAGARVEPSKGIVAAIFRHRSSRAGDPQLHSHVVVANLGQGADGRWTALDGRRLYAHAMTASSVYQAALRGETTRRLEVEWTAVERGIAELTGVPEPVRTAFSRRRADIEAAMAERGTAGARAAAAAALATRQAKDRSISADRLHEDWRARSAGLGWDPPRLIVRDLGARGTAPLEPAIVRLLGPSGLTARGSTFTRRDVVAALAADLPPAVVTLATLEAGADELLASRDVLSVMAPDAEEPADLRSAEQRYTTAELLATERRLIDGVAAGPHAERALAPLTAAADRLSPEQRRAVEHLVGGGDAVGVLCGRAGTGKTFALGAAREAWEAAGHAVFGVAVARRAAHELERGAGVPSTSVTAMLAVLDRRPVLPFGAVMIVDEAGMIGTRDLARLADHVERARGKLVLVGDHRQLPEIDAGGTFHALVRRGFAVELRENRRQVNAWERTAIDHLRDGRPEQALAIYDAHDRVHLDDRREVSRRRLVDDWVSADGDAVMIAARRTDVDDLNRRAREVLRERGRLGDAEIRFAGTRLAAGDQIVVRRNDDALGVTNGERGTVLTVDAQRRQVTLDFGGRHVEVGASFAASRTRRGGCPLEHAYAITCHIAQGATVDHAFVLADRGVCREWGYTALTRGRHSNHIYAGRDTEHDRAEYGPVGTATPSVDALKRLADDLRRAEAQTLALDAGRYKAPERAARRTEGIGR